MSLALFLYLQILDTLSTLVVLHLGGTELNPMIRFFLRAGPGGLWFVKSLIAVFAVWVRAYFPERARAALNSFYVIIVLLNLSGLVRFLQERIL